MKFVHTILTMASLLTMLPTVRGNDPEVLPNIVLIFIDDMGYADIGPFGGKIPTPHLDRMAAEGRCFENFIVSSPVCSASRAALMTGCFHQRVGITGALSPTATIGLDPEEETIAEICKQKKYATACFGKWHLGHLPHYLPLNQGFDEYFGLPYSNDMWPLHPDFADLPAELVARKQSLPPLKLIDGNTVLEPQVSGDVQKRLTSLYTERAVDFIKRNKNNLFFLYLPHSMVHVPLFVSDAFAGKSGAGLFGDVVMELDWSVGQILDTLRSLDLDKKTLVILTSDNGPWLAFGNHAGSAGPFREGKGTCFEGGIREPTIFWWPDRIPAGTRCKELASTIDILPTVGGLIGAELPKRKIDGKNIADLITGKEGAKSPHEAFPVYYNGKLRAVRDSRWKLVFPHKFRTLGDAPGGENGSYVDYVQKNLSLSLFDLKTDPGETRDVSAEHPQKVRRLRKAATAIIDEIGENNRSGKRLSVPAE